MHVDTYVYIRTYRLLTHVRINVCKYLCPLHCHVVTNISIGELFMEESLCGFC